MFQKAKSVAGSACCTSALYLSPHQHSLALTTTLYFFFSLIPHPPPPNQHYLLHTPSAFCLHACISPQKP